MSSARHAKPRSASRAATRTAAPAVERRGGGGRHRAPAPRGGIPAPAAVGAAAVAAAAAGVAVVPGLGGAGEPADVAVASASAADLVLEVATDLGAPGIRQADRVSRDAGRRPLKAPAAAAERATEPAEAAADLRAARERAKSLLDAKVAQIAEAAEQAAREALPAALDRSGCGYDPGAQRRPEPNATQLRNARTIVKVAQEMGLPPRAAVIALATAQQESELLNLNWGDRDSLGLFQQRPSMGWGSPSQVRDPEYAARKFFRALQDVDGWEKLPLTVAAQKVQRSAFPWAYARWELMAAKVVQDQLDDVSPRELGCAR